MNHAHLSTALQRIEASPTTAMTDRATELREQGRDIISLSVGEPDFATPPHVIEAAKAALDAGDTKYTPVTGTARLKKAAALHFERDLGIATDPAQRDRQRRAASRRSSRRCAATLSDGDEVIIPSPWWVSYPQIVRFCGGRVVPLTTHPHHGFRFDPAEVEALIGPRTHWLHAQQPGQPDRRGLSRGHAARDRRSAAPPPASAGAERRYLFAADLHRRSRTPRSPRCAPTLPTASAPSRASPRATR